MRKLHLAPLAGATLLVTCAQSAFEVARAQDATIINARIVVGDGPVIPNGYITFERGKIVTVAPDRPSKIVGTLIDAGGMTAVPGFIDGHKHLNTSPLGEKAQMEDLIDSGFTTVLSALGPVESNLELIQKIDSGQLNGPRIIASSGRLDLRASPEQTRATIRALAAQGIHFTGEIAVTPEPGATPHELAVLKAAVEEGKKDGVEILVHAVSTPAMVAVSEAGIHHEVHLPNKDFMSYDDAARIAESGTRVLDTVSFGAPIIDVFQQDNQPRFRTGLLWPESIAGANRDEQGRATGTEAAYSMMNARRIWDATRGRGLGYGSDQNYPVRDVLEHELKSLMMMLSVPDVIRVLTINTASFLNMENEIGTLEPLKRADILLLEGNPFEDFNDLLKVRVVLKDGKVVVDKRGNHTGPELGAAGGASGATRTAPPAPARGAQAGPMVGTLTASVARPDQAPVTSCQQLSRLPLAEGRVTVAAEAPASSIQVPASPAGDRRAHAVELPAHCVVAAQLRRSRGADIRLTLWLPTNDWNGSFLLIGDGSPIASEALERRLLRGYAVASAGPASGSAERGAPTAREGIELANRAVHERAEKSKAIIRAYYGATPRYSYWISTTTSADGQPLEEVRMHPVDFDGVVVGGEATAVTGSPDLSAFARRGGKIIEHRVAAQGGGLAHARDFYRLFLMPEQQRGDSYEADWLTALDEWVQRSHAPDMVLADHFPPPDVQRRPSPGLVFEPQFGVRTVCSYPNVARLQSGAGETPVDWLCVPGPAAGPGSRGGSAAQN